MDYNFEPSNIEVEGYSTCTFYFLDGHVSYWGDDPPQGINITHHSVVQHLDRVNLEYNSPLIEGVFPEDGYFVRMEVQIEESGSSNVSINKVFIPKDCNRVVLSANVIDPSTSEEVEARCTITLLEGAETQYATILTFASYADPDKAFEVQRHEYNEEHSNSYGFSFEPHELQINGSEYRMDYGDYYFRPRTNYRANLNIEVPEFVNFALARNFSKYYIGTPRR